MSVIDPQLARGPAMARLAEAMLRAMGGCEVRLLLPAPNTGDATKQQLGLAAVGVEEVVFAPVVVCAIEASGQEKQSIRRFELLFAASTITPMADAREVVPAEALFTMARGVLCGDQRLHIESVSVDRFAGAPYLYRVKAVEV